jgi:hypothetical protein
VSNGAGHSLHRTGRRRALTCQVNDSSNSAHGLIRCRFLITSSQELMAKGVSASEKGRLQNRIPLL